ncbi:MAG: heme-binding protein [Candidatus Obscuribacterales bacterium]|nr:heme-binding protein [Candidatus Obscuribacterales bacterium]
MKKLTGVLLLSSALAATVGLSYLSEAKASYEEPRWKSLKKDGKFELRLYPSVVAASVTVPLNNQSTSENAAQAGKDSKAMNKAFGVLAGYIFGKNKSKSKIAMTVPVTEIRKSESEKIAMTVPVVSAQSGSRSDMTMSFYMPSSYKIEDLPEALDKNIQFAVVPSKTYATVRFSGLAGAEAIATNTRELKSFIEKSKLEIIGEPISAYYNPPWTLPFLRRNEVWIEVKTEQP